MKTIYILAVLGLSVTTSEAAHALPHADTNRVQLTSAYFNELAAELAENHPMLRAARSRTRAASLNTNSVRVWEDPMFRFGGVASSSRGPRLDEEGDLVYGLEQKLPLFGKARSARRVAEAEAESEISKLAYQAQLLRRDLARSLLKTALADRSVEIATHDVAWLETMADATQEHYRAGTATQVELLRIQNERARRVDQLRTEIARRNRERVAINRLLNRKLDAPLPQLELPPPAGPLTHTRKLEERALQFEPQLRVLRQEIRRAESSVAVTRKSRLPDISAGIEGRQYSGDGGFREGMFSVSLSLPWFNRGKYRSDLARDEERLKAAEFEVENLRLSAREELHHLLIEIDAARREALLYQDEVWPRSRQALESAHANWSANRGMFNEVMESRRMLLEAQLMHARAVSEQHQLLAELALLCGLENPDLLPSLAAPEGAASPAP